VKRFLAAVAFVIVATPAFAQFGQNKIVYDKFRWNVYHATHFDVYFYDEEKPSLQKVVDNAESAYDDLSRKFNFQISKKIPIIFYATHSAFEQTNVDLNFIPEAVGAFAEPVRNRMVIPIDTTDEKLLQLITHELTHVFEYEILFQGKLGKTIAASPPTWFMEGLASFMGQDEDSKDRMVLRDAVVNDRIPAITRNPTGYFAYRFGHAVFRFIQEKYGWDGLRDFIYEYRNTLGNSVERALKRAFDVAPDEFNTQFRMWLRRQYLPALISKGEPQEYGDPFKINPEIESDEISPVPSPSGDLLAGYTTYKEDVDVAIFNVPERHMLKNLTPGYTSKYEYPAVQSFTVSGQMGRDLAWAPNGDQIALFVKKERGRNLMLINPITSTIDRSVPLEVEQELSPTYSPDGRKIAFSGFRGNQPDIFTYDIATGEVSNLTKDEYYDGAPVYSPDGKWLVYSSVIDGFAKLIKMSVSNPKERYQLTSGSWNDIDAYFSPDGKRIFFTSDKQTGRNIEIQEAVEDLQKVADKVKNQESVKVDPTNYASYNIYSLNLENGDLLQYTDVVGGVFTPVVFTGKGNREQMVFASYYKGRWQLFSTPTDKPLHQAEKTAIPSAPLEAESRTPFQPPVEVAIDPEKIDKPDGFKLFVDDVQVNAGVTSDQLFVSNSVIYMSDMLGNRRFIAVLDTVSSFSNFDFLYFDLHNRTNWGFRVFDNRSYFTSYDYTTGFVQRDKQAYRETGAIGILTYPVDRYHRIDMGLGYESRDYYTVTLGSDPLTGLPAYIYVPRQDNFPLITGTYTGDSTQFKSFGPISGRRYNISGTYAPDTSGGGTLTANVEGEWREYLQLSSRTLLAARMFAGYANGSAPNYYFFGGLNTLRGYDYRSIVGDHVAFGNFEFRFPLIDLLATPILVLPEVRGMIFMDIGGAAISGQPYQFMRHGQMLNGVASVGYGLSFFFMGLEMHWDFAKHFKPNPLDPVKGYRSSFWIGNTF